MLLSKIYISIDIGITARISILRAATMFFLTIAVFDYLFGFPKVTLLRFNYFMFINCP